ncbi:hypothetical protein FC50_GL002314 [Lacticaseibacillus pantheris DSM 15945 = JCM 12539 = NBRC 106106]|uniref:Uncharacterized protein n=1 Tax=Lacticaseibacillus pantheris DSM 15945 = JCM 12539 = NBRC 106106 TaxID=1423783 RepID=A0A0R1U8N2_9LACO|nr:hypothetical protein FC50_GL002314 [Lacticaseibacillus pantheris DSM 15945 = JCM 12539 = NBRC 106106]
MLIVDQPTTDFFTSASGYHSAPSSVWQLNNHLTSQNHGAQLPLAARHHLPRVTGL